MRTLSDLIVSIAPLLVFAAISPVVFLNASTAVSRGGQRGGWQFVAGNAMVIVALGAACVGLLGTAATGLAEREIASRTVDRMLGIALLCYGGYMAYTHHRSRSSRQADADQAAGEPAPTAAARDGLVVWGAIGMMTNFTTLPVFASVSQRIGAANIDWAARVLVLALACVVVLTPSWLPVVIARLAPGRSEVSASTRARIAHWTGLVSIGACLVGGVILLITSG